MTSKLFHWDELIQIDEGSLPILNPYILHGVAAQPVDRYLENLLIKKSIPTRQMHSNQVV